MSRIRSIHPGLFTDEAYVSVSMAARVLLPGIWTECDDQGVFEWKPLRFKMKIFPADSVDVDALLAELVAADCVQGFSFEGKGYGAVRNFGKFQRPKKPQCRFPLPDELRTYVASKPLSGEPVTHQLPTSSEIPPQMEDGGGRKEEERAPSLRSGGARKRGTRLPEDFQLNAGLIDFAEGHGLAGDALQAVFSDFCDYWHARAGPQGLKLDWSATWRRWVREESKRRKPQGVSNGHGPNRPNGLAASLARLGEVADDLERHEQLSEGSQAPPRLLSHG